MQQQIIGGLLAILALGVVVFNRKLVAMATSDMRITAKSMIVFSRVVFCLVGAILCYFGTSSAFQWARMRDGTLAATSFDQILFFSGWGLVAIWMALVVVPGVLRGRRARRGADKPKA